MILDDREGKINSSAHVVFQMDRAKHTFFKGNASSNEARG